MIEIAHHLLSDTFRKRRRGAPYRNRVLLRLSHLCPAPCHEGCGRVIPRLSSATALSCQGSLAPLAKASHTSSPRFCRSKRAPQKTLLDGGTVKVLCDVPDKELEEGPTSPVISSPEADGEHQADGGGIIWTATRQFTVPMHRAPVLSKSSSKADCSCRSSDVQFLQGTAAVADKRIKVIQRPTGQVCRGSASALSTQGEQPTEDLQGLCVALAAQYPCQSRVLWAAAEQTHASSPWSRHCAPTQVVSTSIPSCPQRTVCHETGRRRLKSCGVPATRSAQWTSRVSSSMPGSDSSHRVVAADRRHLVLKAPLRVAVRLPSSTAQATAGP
ncbi:hypothetical protein CRENBAI_006015 [Crenichthys baileyi]|uniref:Uncharacterized protein n=1 Tax=Crenichthys baileyi TaxID=28760 RepID=A0AAV9QQ28_9TELE